MVTLQQYGDIALWIYAEPKKSKTADKYFPGQQQGVSNYRWILGTLYTDSYLSFFQIPL